VFEFVTAHKSRWESSDQPANMLNRLKYFAKIACLASVTSTTHYLTRCETLESPMKKSGDIALLSGTGNPALSKAISDKLGIPLTKLKLDRFSGKF
jgi:hypothetical protein